LPRRYETFLTTMILLWSVFLPPNGFTQTISAQPTSTQTNSLQATVPQANPSAGIAAFEGKVVQSIELPGVAQRDRGHIMQLVVQKPGEPLNHSQVGDSIRALYATGRFADIQAEAAPSGDGIILTFATSANYFMGAINVEGAPTRPNANQIINASKLQLGELYTADKLNRGLENVRQLLQEDGYYRTRVTAESTSNLDTQQVDILIHVTAGAPAHVGAVTVTGSSSFSSSEIQKIAHLRTGDRLTAARISGSLQHLRKRFQKQSRSLAQVEIAEQKYLPESNAVDFTFQIDPGPIVEITAQGYHVSRGVMKKEIPVYEENAVDDDLLNEGRQNLLDYLQTRGHFDATVDIQKETSDPKVLRVIYQINPGPMHKLVLVEITGNKEFMDTKSLLSRMEIQQSTPLINQGRYSGILLKNDVAMIEGLYRSNGYRQVHVDTKVDDNYRGAPNQLAVHINIDEGPQTRVGQLNIAGNAIVPTQELPELTSQPNQPYSEQNLASDRERILSYYFDHGFPNASLEITTKDSVEPHREDVIFTISEGERFTVNRVMVGGTEHTRDYVVQRELEVKEGDPLSQQDLLNTQTRLYNLGIFSEVDTAVQNPEGTDPQKNVLVQVEEAKRYTFTYGVGLEAETGLPSGTTAPQGTTGVSPRVEFDVTRLNVAGRDQTLTFQSHVGKLQQRGLISYTVPKLFDNDKFKLIYTIFYDNSLNVATFTSQRLEGKIDLRQQFGNTGFEPGTRPGPDAITYRFDFRTVKASHFAEGFSPGEIAQLSLPARVGGPGFTFIHDKRDNPLESTKGDYFTLDAAVAASFFGTRSEAEEINSTTGETTTVSLPTNYARALAQYSTYYVLGHKSKPGHQWVFARSTTLGIQQPFRGTKVLPPGSCPLNSSGEPNCPFATIPLPEQFFAGGGNSLRGFGLNQAGPRDPGSGFPLGGTAEFVNSEELRLPPLTLPLLGEGFGFAVFHDMGNIFTAPHDMLKGLLRWHQADPNLCLPLPAGTTTSQCVTQFDNSGYDFTSHAVGVGVRYKTPIGPLRFDFGYNLNPTSYFQVFTYPIPNSFFGQQASFLESQRLRHFNFFFSIGQPF
jgi:outer membrane protein insertion porin family